LLKAAHSAGHLVAALTRHKSWLQTKLRKTQCRAKEQIALHSFHPPPQWSMVVADVWERNSGFASFASFFSFSCDRKVEASNRTKSLAI
jgi:hypothetical protein